VGERVDSSHDALGGTEEGLDGGFGEQRPVEAGELESVFEVEAGGVAVEATQGEVDGDSLGEGLEVRQSQGLSQSGLPREEHGEPPLAVPVKVGEQGQEGEDDGSQVVGLVEEEQDGKVSFLDEALDLGLEESEGHGPGPQGLQAEGEGDLATEVGRVDEGVMQVQSADLIGVELVAQSPQSGGLSAAGLAGEQADGSAGWRGRAGAGWHWWRDRGGAAAARGSRPGVGSGRAEPGRRGHRRPRRSHRQSRREPRRVGSRWTVRSRPTLRSTSMRSHSSSCSGAWRIKAWSCRKRSSGVIPSTSPRVAASAEECLERIERSTPKPRPGARRSCASRKSSRGSQ
jgi:hypothetical protein